jgi:hypothetical protein
MVGRCRLTVSNPVLKAPMVSVLQLPCDEALSNFAFTFNLRRYTMGSNLAGAAVPVDRLQDCVNVILSYQNPPSFRNTAGGWVGPCRCCSPRHRMPCYP